MNYESQERNKGLFPLLLFSIFAVLCSIVACVPEEEIVTHHDQAKLSFSRDTVLFDTLFSAVGSITKSFKVYNRNENAVQISSVTLGKGAASAYKIYINGKQDTHFTNVRLLGSDSLLVLVEVFINPQDKDLPFLVRDSLVFTTNQNKQDVKLITWGQDAHFLSALHIQQDTILTGDRPYLIYDSLWVAPDATLHIEKGARLYFNTGSSLIVNGSLLVTGTAEEKVLFHNDRLDGPYKDAPGQWQGIYLNGQNNSIDHAIIRNAEVGVLLEGHGPDTIPDLTASHTIIENMSRTGIAAFHANIDAFNLLINHCAINLVRNVGGGYYRYIHCTFASSFPGFPQVEPALFLADTLSGGSSQSLHLILKNNIIWGIHQNELAILTEKPGSVVEVRSNLIKTKEQAYAELNILNQDPLFTDPFQYNYHLDSGSAAINQAEISRIKKDLEGNHRDSLPDLGAYEYTEK